MSAPLPGWLASRVTDYRTGMLNDAGAVDLFADLIVNGCVPDDMQPAVTAMIADGHLTPAGDVVDYPSDTPAHTYVQASPLPPVED